MNIGNGYKIAFRENSISVMQTIQSDQLFKVYIYLLFLSYVQNMDFIIHNRQCKYQHIHIFTTVTHVIKI